MYCSNCWQEFDPINDWRAPAVTGGECFHCSTAAISAELKRDGFINGMRSVDTATLRRWASNTMITTRRREVAAQILHERGL